MSKGDVWRLIHQIRDIQSESRHADYYDTDWSDSLADLAVQLADAVAPLLGADPRVVEQEAHERRLADIDRQVRASWRNPRYR